MFKIGKFTVYTESEEFQHNAVFAKLQRDKKDVEKEAARVPALEELVSNRNDQILQLQAQIKELENEVLQLQKSTFVPLSPTDGDTPKSVPAVQRGGRRKKAEVK